MLPPPSGLVWGWFGGDSRASLGVKLAYSGQSGLVSGLVLGLFWVVFGWFFGCFRWFWEGFRRFSELFQRFSEIFGDISRIS